MLKMTHDRIGGHFGDCWRSKSTCHMKRSDDIEESTNTRTRFLVPLTPTPTPALLRVGVGVRWGVQFLLLLVSLGTSVTQNHLKAEIEVFITSIFLRILESEHSDFDHKVGRFVNYTR